jgi:hypothetical protein
MTTSNTKIGVEPDFDSPEARMAMRKRHLEIALRMQAVALYALEELERKVAARERVRPSATDAQTLLEAGRTLEFRATGPEERDGGDAPKRSPKKPN